MPVITDSLIYDKEKGIYVAQNYEGKQVAKESNAVKKWNL